MNDTRFQHLSEAFNSIISMMLASLRARGLRGLRDLPQMILAALYLRRLGREFAAIIASLDLGNLPPPAPRLALPEHPAAPAHLAAAASPRHARPVRTAQPGATRARPAAAMQAAQSEPAAPTIIARRTRTPPATRPQAFAQPRRTQAAQAPARPLQPARTS